ncbi:MAG: RNA pseudouridine synthase [Pirellulales bacterium]
MLEPGFDLLYRSPRVLAALKPAGLATQAPPGIESLEARIKAWLREESADYSGYLAVPHRLDRPVSGAMVFATHPNAARKISRQFERRQVRKVYWACLERQVQPAEGTWTDHVRKVYGHPRAEIVAADHPEGRLAILHYRTLAEAAWGVWLEVVLETGRTHQVRIQASSRGHPILGDVFYGATSAFGTPHEDERLRAIALHGRELAFRDPSTGQDVSVVAPLSDDWRRLGLPPEKAEGGRQKEE